jgi:DnaK suppressor protein
MKKKQKAQKIQKVRKIRSIRDTAVLLPPEYRPKLSEPFMNMLMREYFRQKLIFWRSEILREAGVTMQSLQTESLQEPDVTDRASLETDMSLALRARDRERKLLNKINAALRRIQNGTYGYCEETGEPIHIRRLEARPIATLSIEAQERHERLERMQRDD